MDRIDNPCTAYSIHIHVIIRHKSISVVKCVIEVNVSVDSS